MTQDITMTFVWMVAQGQGGAWEPDAVLSVWDSKEKAVAERARLIAQENDDDFWVYRATLNTQSQDVINFHVGVSPGQGVIEEN